MNLPQLLITHKAAIFTGAGWAVHALSMHFPYLRDNGGIVGLDHRLDHRSRLPAPGLAA